MNRRVLFVAYQFPPVGGAGVQRIVKFSKYLPEHGWSVSVLTVSNPSVPLLDTSLCSDIPRGTMIRKAASWEPSYRLKNRVVDAWDKQDSRRRGLGSAVKGFLRRCAINALQPDAQVLWAPAAIREGLQLLRECPHHAILVSGPPFSAFLVGVALSQKTGLPLVLDYRDEWTISNRYWENKAHNRITRMIQRRLQRIAIDHAHALVATTRMSAQTLRSESRSARRTVPVQCIYNGFDPQDFSDNQPLRRDDGNRFRLSHIGTLWRLTSPEPLTKAVERLADRRPDLAARLDIEIVGRSMPGEQSAIDRLASLPCRVVRHDYVDHSSAVQIMCETDELCLLLSDVPGAERVMPGKTFEYLATGRRILAIAPQGEMRRILECHEGVQAFSPDETTSIAEHLARSIDARSRERVIDTYVRNIAQFDRREQAGELAQILDRLAIAEDVAGSRRTWGQASCLSGRKLAGCCGVRRGSPDPAEAEDRRSQETSGRPAVALVPRSGDRDTTMVQTEVSIAY